MMRISLTLKFKMKETLIFIRSINKKIIFIQNNQYLIFTFITITNNAQYLNYSKLIKILNKKLFR